MHYHRNARASAIASAITLVGIICSCGPTDPSAPSGTGAAPSITAIGDATVFPGEPIDVRISAIDAEGDAISYSLVNSPTGATIDHSTGLFSWRPALADSGEKTIVFQASDGSHEATMSARFTVVIPALGTTEAVRILRPAPGDTFTYGDTLTIAVAMKWCGLYAMPLIYIPGMPSLCAIAPDAQHHPVRDLDDSTDADGRVCRFSRRFPDRQMWIAYYRFPLTETTFPSGCSVEFGRNTEVRDSVFLQVKDPYGDQRSGCNLAAEPQIMSALLTGTYCKFFNVAPR